MSQTPFQKFTPKKKNSVVKEEFRQEKKKARQEKRGYFEKKKKEEYEARQAKKTGVSSRKAEAGSRQSGVGSRKSGVGSRESGVGKLNSTAGTQNKQLSKDSGLQTTDSKLLTEVMPLNKYLAHCGICSRRDAVPLIEKGLVKVNGKVVNEPGYKVQPADEVVYNSKKLFVTKNLVYILLNKPKDYITTNEDPQGRKTVMQLIRAATDQRVYPIGRLDRNTSGVLLLTNDGDLTQKLSHPSYEVTKIYEVKLDKPLTKNDFEKIVGGLKLEDGEVRVDSLAWADAKDKSIIGIELHSGRNRIVRRIFEHLGYDVKGLDRVMYANLTKKNVERGKWRYLSEKEIRLLKYMNASRKK